MTRNARKVAEKILTAGAIFLGPWSPTVLGDYVAGPSHTLPTGGAGASFAGLTVDQFQRRTSIVEYNRAALKKALPAVKKFAEIEGLDAHGFSGDSTKIHGLNGIVKSPRHSSVRSFTSCTPTFPASSRKSRV